MAAAASFVSIQNFGGSSTENWTDFESLFRSFIQDLCPKKRQKLILRELCPVNDWSRDGFNEMNNDNTYKFLNIIIKISENQTSLEPKLKSLAEKFNTQQSPSNSGPNYQYNYQNQRSRDKYRGKYNNRGIK